MLRPKMNLAPMPDRISSQWWPIKGAPDGEWIEVCRMQGGSVLLAFAMRDVRIEKIYHPGGPWPEKGHYTQKTYVRWCDAQAELTWSPTHWRLPSGFPLSETLPDAPSDLASLFG